MHLHNSSTSSSKPSQVRFKSLSRRGQTVVTGILTLIFLILIDWSVNVLFPYPADPLAPPPGQLKTYFEYGRSLEGKLNRMIGATDEKSALLALPGWFDSPTLQKPNLPVRHSEQQDLLIASYGMSFSNRVTDQLEKLDPKIGVRSLGGPAAPPNHSFATYQADRGRHEAEVVSLAVLASSVKAMRTLSGMTWQFESPAPYTYPRYFLNQGKLQAITPVIQSLDGFRTALRDREQWKLFTDQLRSHDAFYSDFLMHRNALDRSVLIRLLRRAWAQRHQSRSPDAVFNAEDVAILQAIVRDFALSVKQDGKFPIVLLFNDRGYQDDLFQALKPTLEADSIAYVSSHTISPATKLENFEVDGHFVPSVDRQIAQEMLKLINAQFHRG